MSLNAWEILYLPYFFENMKFKLIDNLKFVTVDMDYLRKLHTVSSEVFYKESDYENKPYLGILLSTDNYKYVIPITSSKEKHKYWKLIDKDKFLIYEKIKGADLCEKDIWVKNPFIDAKEDDVLHIFSAIDLKKMVPIIDSVIKPVNIHNSDDDTREERLYKDLLRNEYDFCVTIIDKIFICASKICDKQTTTKNGLKFCCDFKALEKVVDNYNKNGCRI